MEKTFDSDYSVRLATLAKLGGDADKNKYDSIYQVDLAILEATQQGGGGSVTPEQVHAIIEEYNYTTMSDVEAKKYMQQKKLTLNGDDPLQILDEAGNVLTYEDVKTLVDNKALFVYILVDNAFYIPCGDMVVPSGHNAVEFSSAFIVSGEASIARIIIDTTNTVLYEQYWLADKEWVRGQIPSLTGYVKVVTLTQAEYDALATKDAATLYVITDAE